MRFLKALCTAQFASIVDFVVTVLLSSVFGVYYVAATALGAIAGGVSNCIFNYRWVFPASGSPKRNIALKYFLVWAISILLNTYGTYLLTEALRGRTWVVAVLGTHSDQVYIASKLIVAVLVAVCWNYQMQRLFVYRRVRLCCRCSGSSGADEASA